MPSAKERFENYNPKREKSLGYLWVPTSLLVLGGVTFGMSWGSELQKFVEVRNLDLASVKLGFGIVALIMCNLGGYIHNRMIDKAIHSK